MLRIAICDDDNLICLHIKTMLSDILQELKEEGQTVIFTSGEALYKHLCDKEQFDIIFLDIELPKIDGISVGKKIREDICDEITKIIYISSQTNYAVELFDIRPLNFLTKPIKWEKLKGVIKTALRLIEQGNIYFNYQYQYEDYRVQIKDIIFFSSKGRKITIHLINGYTKEFNGKLKEIAEELGKKDFLLIHKSFLVNRDHVVDYRYDAMTMSNDVVLNISQANRKAVRHSFLLMKARR